MRIIDWSVENGQSGGTHTGTIEVEDDATEEQIESAVSDEVFNIISWGWSERDAGRPVPHHGSGPDNQ